MTSFNVPYHAESAALPAALPTVEEIQSSQDVILGDDSVRKKVVGIGDHFVVKYGAAVDPHEARTMLFLRQATSVPVPIIYAIFQIKHPKADHIRTTYIVMERIQGETLESKWSSMDQATKEVVVSKLRPVFEEMRKLISPGGYCAICHRGLKDDFFWTQEPDDPDHPFVGPFDTESSLNDAMVRTCFNTSARKHSADFYSRALEAALHDHPPTFSHGDIQRKNIMIRSVGGSSSQTKQPVEAEIEIVLIDWEIAEWYPSYWDYAKAMYAAARLDDDWRFWLEKFLEPYYNGFAWQYLLGMQCMGC